MFKSLFYKMWSLRRKFIRYFIVGISGLVIDIGLLWLLKERGHMRAVIAIIFSQIIVLSYNFTFNKLWAFGSKGLSHTQLVRYIVTAAWNYFFAIVFMWVFNEKLGLNYLIVRLVSIALMVSWNFLLYHFWIFPRQTAPLPMDT